MPSAFCASTASTTPLGVTTARAGPSGSADHSMGATVVVVGGCVVVDATVVVVEPVVVDATASEELRNATATTPAARRADATPTRTRNRVATPRGWHDPHRSRDRR